MIAAKPPDKFNGLVSKNFEEQFSQKGALYYQAIENAEGVPFQLMFGPEPGQGYYLNVGAGIRQLLGIAPEDFTEKIFHEMILEIVPLSDDTVSDLSESRKKIIGGDLINYKAEVLIKMAGGDRKWILDSSLPLLDDESGKVIGVFGILFDIDAHKQTLKHLDKALEKADESDRLKIAFLRNISHEIRTPLNAIVGFTSLLNDYKNGPEVRQEYLDIICQSSDHLLDIINDIVEISNIETNSINISRDEININNELRKLYDQLNPIAADKNIFFRFACAADENEIFIYTDPGKLNKILKNLIGNSLKFTLKGEVEFGFKVIDNSIEFCISDSGIGIPLEYQQLIFNKFYQVENSSTRRFEGTGLGLTISKAYVELLGGKIWFTSQPGKGSEFYFTIPFEKKD
ncbi:MAG TPA: ATP-binding protein [Bacteroidales bacterium]|nr:ATP-binding protein [Bacteroidales bacterium]